MKTLLEILSLKRPHGGEGERFVAEKVLTRLPHDVLAYYGEDNKPKAYVVGVGESTTLFTAHLDTVHREDGPNPVEYDEEAGWVFKEDGTPLGADNGAGVWLLYKMAEAGVPGTYLFTVGEERGGIGAKWMAENAAEFLERFDRAIAFDRKGANSVITHQGFGRCCSDEFAWALSAKLGMEFKPDDTGIYTDTAEFTEIIPECTNVSCGYAKEHTPQETLDVTFLHHLLSACLELDWSSLPVSRDPDVVEDVWGWGRSANEELKVATTGDLFLMTKEERLNLCYEEPETVAALLEELMYCDFNYGG